MVIRLACATAAAFLAVSCAPYDDAPDTAMTSESGRDCFFLSEVDGFNRLDKDRIRVSTGPSEAYEFEVFGPCPQLGDREHLAFDQTGGGTICRGIDVDLLVPTDIGVQRCPVRMIRKIEE